MSVTVMMAMSSNDWDVTEPTSFILRMVSSSGRVTSSSVSYAVAPGYTAATTAVGEGSAHDEADEHGDYEYLVLQSVFCNIHS